ncbi:Sua5/YciO/YrdC/YwlC family protein [Mycoplasma sp. Mirounga ES2805-ORL]|uniref:Sua5/YciO/YrdC/YwlC family protein n=1 Tax=Mycoplasma sp. Mirounga ES2805-ORL TaxID=754514 RepID=UPI00197B4C9D|nr:Sua5/YciO/YrdC/YwlC family protein [Mycoplasma sp. Mirounga ES2805-ORL]QSF13892.1 Sua5/YciO/YrdC/YwlC family protein [Mycoplasma sp. Mirounga ES2805-ORL]
MNFKDIFICTTDTVTGLGGPISQETLDAIYTIKKRPLTKKIMILVGSVDQARKFKEWNKEADLFAEKYWPGAYSVVVNKQGFRMPNNKQLIDFLLKHGPCYVTSANISGQEPLQLNEAKKIFTEIKNFYDFGSGSNEASKIFNIDTNEWIR